MLVIISHHFVCPLAPPPPPLQPPRPCICRGFCHLSVTCRPNPQSIAQACLDSFALQLPTKHTFTPLMDLCNSFLGSPEPHMRKAAVAALGVMSEGCAEPIKARLGDILPKILQVWSLVS